MSDQPMREEWAVAHSQGIYTGAGYGRGLTESEARAWAADSAARDAKRRIEARGKTRLLHRYVTEWEEAPR